MNKETTPTKPLPQLLKGSSTYKLVVPASVEQKIRYLINKFPHTEWSGVLFYTHQGSFEDNDLVITCQDIFPMDLGSSGWTEFHMSEDVAAYMAEHIELFECETGLCHSHHSMGAFFSGQDNLMLQQEGNDTNCFVSLVVDTRGSYVARITRKVQAKSEVTVHNLGTSYEFFGEGTKELSSDNTSTTKVISKDTIEYFDLNVERHAVSNDLAYLDARFDEIERKKLDSHAASYQKSMKSTTPISPSSFNTPIPLTNFNDAVPEDKDFFATLHQERRNAMGWTPDPKAIHAAVVHIVTCNLILNPEKVNLAQWIRQHMKNVYRKIFGDPVLMFSDNGTDAFSEWCDFIIQFTIDHFDYSNVPDVIMDGEGEAQAIVAKAIADELSEYFNANQYIEEYISTLSLYITE